MHLRQTLVKAMTYLQNNVGMVSIEDSRRILRAIFPNLSRTKTVPSAETRADCTITSQNEALTPH